jgi:hypothetical protein
MQKGYKLALVEDALHIYTLAFGTRRINRQGVCRPRRELKQKLLAATQLLGN